jgi:hypothetical protein
VDHLRHHVGEIASGGTPGSAGIDGDEDGVDVIVRLSDVLERTALPGNRYLRQ